MTSPLDLFRLDDRVAVVTGGASGVGRGLALGLAAVGARVVVADLLFRSFQAGAGLGEGDPRTISRLFDRGAPIVTLLDGHPHTLSFLGAVGGRGSACLGVQAFGQSGDIAELYEHHQIDAESVVGAALDLL